MKYGFYPPIIPLSFVDSWMEQFKADGYKVGTCLKGSSSYPVAYYMYNGDWWEIYAY